MRTYKLAVLPGDGVGPEVVEQSIKVLKAFEQKFGISFELAYAPIGGAGIESHGVPLPDPTLQLAKEADAVFLGAVGDFKYDNIDPQIRPERGLLKIRKELGLFANLRPVKLYSALAHVSTLKPDVIEGMDMMIVRELTGGLYFGDKQKSETEATDTMRYTRAEIERIARLAFELARQRQGRLCSVDKANVLYTSQLWRETVNELAKAYPDVTVEHMYVDNAAMQLVRSPKQFDVMLTENTFGDILSDEASMLIGSLGMLPSASLGEVRSDGKRYALYESSHGSAPTIARQNKVNPIAQILSLAMMLELSFGLKAEAAQIEQAIEQVLSEGYRTQDILDEGSQLIGTSEMGDHIAKALLKLPQPIAI